MTATRLCGVPADELDAAWTKISPLIETALARSGKFRSEDIRRSIAERKMQLWVAWSEPGAAADAEIEAVAVTEIVDYPLGRAVSIFLCTGRDRGRWLDHLVTIEAWAREAGCRRIESWSRPGWERVLKGWKKTHVFLEKPL